MKAGKRTSEEIKLFLDASYQNKPPEIIGDWILDKSISNKTGKVYYNPKTQEAVVAHRGTKGARDWINNLAYATGTYKHTNRYKRGKNLQDKAEAKYGKQNVSTLGHSQGAVLARELGTDTKEVINVNPAYLGEEMANNEYNIRSSTDIVSGLYSENEGKDIIIPSENPLDIIGEHSYNILDRLENNQLIGQGIKSPHYNIMSFGGRRCQELGYSVDDIDWINGGVRGGPRDIGKKMRRGMRKVSNPLSKANPLGYKAVQNVGAKMGDITNNYLLPAVVSAGKPMLDATAMTASTMLTGNPVLGKAISDIAWREGVEKTGNDPRERQKSKALGELSGVAGQTGSKFLFGKGRKMKGGNRLDEAQALADNYYAFEWNARNQRQGEELYRRTLVALEQIRAKLYKEIGRERDTDAKAELVNQYEEIEEIIEDIRDDWGEDNISSDDAESVSSGEGAGRKMGGATDPTPPTEPTLTRRANPNQDQRINQILDYFWNKWFGIRDRALEGHPSQVDYDTLVAHLNNAIGRTGRNTVLKDELISLRNTINEAWEIVREGPDEDVLSEEEERPRQRRRTGSGRKKAGARTEQEKAEARRMREEDVTRAHAQLETDTTPHAYGELLIPEAQVIGSVPTEEMSRNAERWFAELERNGDAYLSDEISLTQALNRANRIYVRIFRERNNLTAQDFSDLRRIANNQIITLELQLNTEQLRQREREEEGSVSCVASGRKKEPKVDFEKVKWGTFTRMFHEFKKEHPKSRVKDLDGFASYVIKNKKKFSEKALKKAHFYKNIIKAGSRKSSGSDTDEELSKLLDALNALDVMEVDEEEPIMPKRPSAPEPKPIALSGEKRKGSPERKEETKGETEPRRKVKAKR